MTFLFLENFWESFFVRENEPMKFVVTSSLAKDREKNYCSIDWLRIVFVYSSIFKGLGSETIYISVYGSTFMPMCSIYEMGWGNVKRNDGCVPKSKTNPQVLSRSPNIFNQKGTSSCRYQYFP